MAVHEYPQSHGSLIGLSDTDHHKQYGLMLPPGPASARPTGPWREGRWYYANDTGVLSYDNGGGWVDVPRTDHAHALPTGKEYVTSLSPGANLDASMLPQSYPVGVSHGRGNGAGWPVSSAVGNVRTVVQSNGLDVTQFWEGAHISYDIYYRRADGLANAWGAWQLVHSPDSGWVELTGWLNGATAYQTGLGNSWTPRYRKRNNIVYLAGLFYTNATTAPLHVNTLPAGYRPGTGETMLAIPHTGTGVRRMDIASTGTMILREQFAGAATTGWHNLQNAFPAEN